MRTSPHVCPDSWEVLLENWLLYGGSNEKPPSRRSRRGDRRTGMTSGKKRHRGRGLSGLQAAYLLGLLNGKSKRRAALDAGYSRWVADSAAQGVEGKRRGRVSMIR